MVALSWTERLRKTEPVIKYGAGSDNVKVTPEIADWCKNVAREEILTLAGTGVGGSRNGAANKVAYMLGQLVARGGLSRDKTIAALESVIGSKWREEDHWPYGDEAEVYRVLDSAMTAGQEKPFEPWPPRILTDEGKKRQDTRIQKTVASVLLGGKNKLANRKNDREGCFTKYVETIAAVGKTGAVGKEACWQLALEACDANGLLDVHGFDALKMKFDSLWDQTKPRSPWPPQELGDTDNRESWEVDSETGDFLDELKARIGIGKLTGIYNRDGILVKCMAVSEDGFVPPDGDSEDKKINQVKEMTADALRMRISNKYWVYIMQPTEDEETGETIWVEKHIVPPADPCKVIVASPDEALNLPKLKTVVHVPLLRADGSVSTEPGYDRESGVIYIPLDDRAIVVPDNVSGEQVGAARELLLDMLKDFPWEHASDRATYIAGLFTPMMREVVRGPYPWFAISANEMGSGKSKLAYEIQNVLYGAAMQPPPPNDDEEETRKKLTSILRSDTSSVIVFDNVKRGASIGSETMAALATTSRWSDRVLGASESATFTNDRCWWFTGNNIHWGGDMPRRGTLIRLVADPRPWTRTGFTWSLPRDVEAKRPEILAAMLTVAKGWVQAGSPEAATDRADFGEWHAKMRGLLLWAGFEGEVWPTDEIEEPEVDVEWGAFLKAIDEEFGDRWWSTHELADKCGSVLGALPNAIPSELLDRRQEKGFNRLLGRAISSKLDEWLGDVGQMRQVERSKTRQKHGKVVQWVYRVIRQPNFQNERMSLADMAVEGANGGS